MRKGTKKAEAGYSMMELLVVIAMTIVVTAIAVPTYISTSQFLRTAGDLRMLNAVVAQAKMRSAANFTHARVYVDLNANTYQLQTWSKTGGSGGTGCWYPDLDQTQTCVTYSGSAASGIGVTNLANGDTFGFGTLTSGPTPGQTTITQNTAAVQCYPGGANNTDGGSQINHTDCIEFNSRGIPVISNSPVSSGGFYVTNGNIVQAVTVSVTGSIQAWSLPHGSTTWQGQ